MTMEMDGKNRMEPVTERWNLRNLQNQRLLFKNRFKTTSNRVSNSVD